MAFSWNGIETSQ